ncbi:hypothetical protein V8D89_001101 [Ganoderma adspersum]
MFRIASILACDELLRLIFLELRPVYLSEEALNSATHEVVAAVKASRPQARRDLASAALVCRAFTEHALDALWEGLDSLLPIFKVLPSYPSNKRSRPLDLFSHIAPDDWALLRSYARRVKELHLQWSDLQCIASFYSSGASLLPRLQRLQVSDLDALTTAYTIPLLSPTLQSVVVSFDIGTDPVHPDIKDRDNFEVFLGALRIASPSLQELKLSYQYRTFHVGKKHISTLSDFGRLQRFSSLVALDPAAWSQLGSLRSLHHLDISIRASDSPLDLEWDSHSDSELDSTATPDSYFLVLPELQSVRLKGPLDTLTTFLDKLESPSLRSFTCHVHSSPTPSTLVDFLDQAKDKLPRTLHKFTVQCYSVSQPGAGYGQTMPFDLKPLLPPLVSFAEVEDVSLDFYELPVHVSDDAIRILASSLPRLVSLALRYRPPSRYIAPPRQADEDTEVPDRRPTIGALVALATGCPHLARLHVVDIDVEAEAAEEVAVPNLDHKLRELEITSFSTQTQQGVFGFAEKVHRLFPYLMNVRSESGWLAQGAGSGWNVAKAYLGFLQTVYGNSGRLA